jgi:dihydroflavonol-4-reductase
VTVCVTGATGFIGGHVARLYTERGEQVRATYRSDKRLGRLEALDVEPVRADVLDRGSLRRAMRGCRLVLHSAGMVGAHPRDQVWRINALAPRLAVEAAAAEGVERVVLTGSVAGIGPVAPGEVGDEEQLYQGAHLNLAYPDAKHEGEAEGLAAGARLGVDVVSVNPSYVLGPPVDPSHHGETSTRAIANYLRGRLPAVVDGEVDIVDVRDVAAGHVAAAERGGAGERYVLGGHGVRWTDLLERVAELSGVRHPLLVIPPELAGPARRVEGLGLPVPISSEALELMGQNWRYSSAKARRELRFRARSLDSTLRDTIAWCRDLIASGSLSDRPSPLSLAAGGLQLADRVGLLGGLRVAERWSGRRLLLDER